MVKAKVIKFKAGKRDEAKRKHRLEQLVIKLRAEQAGERVAFIKDEYEAEISQVLIKLAG